MVGRDSGLEKTGLVTPLLSSAVADLTSLELVDGDHLGHYWSLFTKCKENIKDGERWENLSWRLWFKEQKEHTQQTIRDHPRRRPSHSALGSSCDSLTSSSDTLSAPPSPGEANEQTRRPSTTQPSPAAARHPRVEKLQRIISTLATPESKTASAPLDHTQSCPVTRVAMAGLCTAPTLPSQKLGEDSARPLETATSGNVHSEKENAEQSKTQMTTMPPPTGRLARPKNMFFINTPVKDGIRRSHGRDHSSSEDSGSSYSAADHENFRARQEAGSTTTRQSFAKQRSLNGLKYDRDMSSQRRDRDGDGRLRDGDDDEEDDDDDDDSSAWGSADTSSAASSIKEKNMFPKVPTRSSTHLPSLVEIQDQDSAVGKPGLLSNLFRTASHKTLKRTQTAPLSRPLSRQVSPTQTLGDVPSSRLAHAARYRPSSKSQVDVPLAHATLAAPSASISTSNIMSTSHGGSKQTATDMMKSQRSALVEAGPSTAGQSKLKRVSTYAGPLTTDVRPLTGLNPGPTVAEHSSALNAVRSMARSKRSASAEHVPEAEAKGTQSNIRFAIGEDDDGKEYSDDSIPREDEDDDDDEEEDDAFVAPIFTPRTTRKFMLATELSESLRRNLIWERQQRVTLPKITTSHSQLRKIPADATVDATATANAFVSPPLQTEMLGLQLNGAGTEARIHGRSLRAVVADRSSGTCAEESSGKDAMPTSPELAKAQLRQEQFRRYFMEDPGYHAVGW